MSSARHLDLLSDPVPANTLIDALPVAVYTTDAAGRITSYNDAAVAF